MKAYLKKWLRAVILFVKRIPCAIIAVLQVLVSPNLYNETMEIDCEDWYTRILA